MKVKLNIKSNAKIYQKVNWPILGAFLLTVVISVLWLYGLNGTRAEYVSRISEYEAKTAEVKARVAKNDALKKNVENKQFIDRDNLASINQKVTQLGKFTGQKPLLYNFFQALEDAMTSEIFITKIYNNAEKNNELGIEGMSSNADNITEFVKKLQTARAFTNVDLKKIAGDNINMQKSLRFLITFNHENAAMLQFPAITPEEKAAPKN
ncbi:MAG TPA: PilN domain-containing protein [Candidatus Wallbacteria bacterium]|nr:PilN domain-containing protein [Candidatus Wallbacteria bacterium]